MDIYILRISGGGATAVDDPWASMYELNYELNQNYPNPFNLSTTIEYSLPRVTDVSLIIYNILGQVIRKWDYEFQQAGLYSVPWDGRDESGHVVASGVYIYRLQTANYSQSKRMILLK